MSALSVRGPSSTFGADRLRAPFDLSPPPALVADQLAPLPVAPDHRRRSAFARSEDGLVAWIGPDNVAIDEHIDATEATGSVDTSDIRLRNTQTLVDRLPLGFIGAVVTPFLLDGVRFTLTHGRFDADGWTLALHYRLDIPDAQARLVLSAEDFGVIGVDLYAVDVIEDWRASCRIMRDTFLGALRDRLATVSGA